MKTITEILYFLRVNRLPFARSVASGVRKTISSGQWQLHKHRLNCGPLVSGEKLNISFAHREFPDSVPSGRDFVSGGAVKYVHLNKRFPHSGGSFNVLYAVSSSHYPRLNELVKYAVASGAKLVWNQNGVHHPQNCPNYEQLNSLMSVPYRLADHVIYQSRFSLRTAHRFLGPPSSPSSVLYNPVDTEAFCPSTKTPSKDGMLRLIVSGSHSSSYRLPCAILALAEVLKKRPARLIIAGTVVGRSGIEARQLLRQLRLESYVDFLGPYSQAEAPLILQRGDIFLHTQYFDHCPTAVIEAMACGLPVVYSKSGGTPELVGPDAGIGVETPESWSTNIPPDPQVLAEGILRIGDDLKSYSLAARQRSLEFDIKPWLRKHEEIIESLR